MVHLHNWEIEYVRAKQMTNIGNTEIVRCDGNKR